MNVLLRQVFYRLITLLQVGEVLGLWAAGLIAERWGYKKTMIGSLLFMNLVIFMMFFAQNIGTYFFQNSTFNIQV
jgi:MFS family permease